MRTKSFVVAEYRAHLSSQIVLQRHPTRAGARAALVEVANRWEEDNGRHAIAEQRSPDRFTLWLGRHAIAEQRSPDRFTLWLGGGIVAALEVRPSSKGI